MTTKISLLAKQAVLNRRGPRTGNVILCVTDLPFLELEASDELLTHQDDIVVDDLLLVLANDGVYSAKITGSSNAGITFSATTLDLDLVTARVTNLEEQISGDSQTVAGLLARVQALESGAATPLPAVSTFTAGNATGTTVAPILSLVGTGGATSFLITLNDAVAPVAGAAGWDTAANWVANGIDTLAYGTHTLRAYAKVGTTVSSATTVSQSVTTAAAATATLFDSNTDNWSTAPLYGFDSWRTSAFLAAGDIADDVRTLAVLAAGAETGLGKCMRAMVHAYCNDQYIGPTKNLTYWAGKAANEANSIYARHIFQLGSVAVPFLFQEDIAPQGFCASQSPRGFEIKILDIGPGIGTSRIIIKLRGNGGNGATLSAYLTGNTPGTYQYIRPTGNPVLTGQRLDVQYGFTDNGDGTQTINVWVAGAAEGAPTFTWTSAAGVTWFSSASWKAQSSMPFEFGYLNNCFNTDQPVFSERMAIHHSYITW